MSDVLRILSQIEAGDPRAAHRDATAGRMRQKPLRILSLIDRNRRSAALYMQIEWNVTNCGSDLLFSKCCKKLTFRG